ncbi:MAG: hypothetical protein QOJ50_566 [Cryptosporangiaceae bacterium]|nr:hypothetical protein [Cryptosporangiaceae bacterium]
MPGPADPSHPRRRWIVPMTSRSPDEQHRVATPLELLFDLCFVVAVAQASGRLHHAIAQGHFGSGTGHFVLVFFAIWWAWMNFTWFASAYDCDDVPYRLTTLVQIGGALTMAAGIPRAFDAEDFRIVTAGYVLMRLAMVAQWLRAAHDDPPRRQALLRYAVGITLVQAGWLARLALPDSLFLPGFAILVLAELAVPAWAERTTMTAWHPHHIAERYGLFTLIVLGESVLSATVAVQAGLDTGQHAGSLIALALAALVIVFAMWWLYFGRSSHELLTSMRSALFWGYGHLLVFGSAAAAGAGLAVAADHAARHGHVSARAAGYAVAIPVAVFVFSVWLLVARRLARQGAIRWVAAAFPVTAVLILLAPLGPAPVPVIAVLLTALVAAKVAVTGPDPQE